MEYAIGQEIKGDDPHGQALLCPVHVKAEVENPYLDKIVVVQADCEYCSYLRLVHETLR